MAYTGKKFPQLKMHHGINRQVLAPITVTGNGLRELRRKNYKHERFVYTIPGRNMLEADKQAIYRFFAEVNYGLDSFVIKDPTIEFNDSPLPYYNTTNWWLNIPYDSTTPGSHPVLNPFIGGLTFKRNGITASGVTLSYTTAGLPYVTVPGSTSLDTITVSGPIYITVRFDGTLTHTTMATEKSTVGGNCDTIPTIVQVGDITLVEVFEK